jgi:chloramphenicol 3-O phosphotransferase
MLFLSCSKTAHAALHAAFQRSTLSSNKRILRVAAFLPCSSFGVSIIGICFWFFSYTATADKSGVVIILNGASASGKSTLQKELQKLFPTPYLGIGLDTFFVGVLPERFVIGPRLKGDIDPALVMQGVSSTDTDGNRLFNLVVGPVGDKVMYGMHRAIAAYAKQGNNCIVDYVAYKKEWITNLCKTLRGIKVYFVGVDCPLDILEQREKARGRSFVEGHARSHHQTVHEFVNNSYDIRVNTGENDAATCAQQIYNFIEINQNPVAFDTIQRN